MNTPSLILFNKSFVKNIHWKALITAKYRARYTVAVPPTKEPVSSQIWKHVVWLQWCMHHSRCLQQFQLCGGRRLLIVVTCMVTTAVPFLYMVFIYYSDERKCLLCRHSGSSCSFPPVSARRCSWEGCIVARPQTVSKRWTWSAGGSPLCRSLYENSFLLHSYKLN